MHNSMNNCFNMEIWNGHSRDGKSCGNHRWDKSDDRCGCGMGIEGVDTNRLVTISEIFVSLNKNVVLWRLKPLV